MVHWYPDNLIPARLALRFDRNGRPLRFGECGRNRMLTEQIGHSHNRREHRIKRVIEELESSRGSFRILFGPHPCCSSHVYVGRAAGHAEGAAAELEPRSAGCYHSGACQPLLWQGEMKILASYSPPRLLFVLGNVVLSEILVCEIWGCFYLFIYIFDNFSLVDILDFLVTWHVSRACSDYCLVDIVFARKFYVLRDWIGFFGFSVSSRCWRI